MFIGKALTFQKSFNPAAQSLTGFGRSGDGVDLQGLIFQHLSDEFRKGRIGNFRGIFMRKNAEFSNSLILTADFDFHGPQITFDLTAG